MNAVDTTLIALVSDQVRAMLGDDYDEVTFLDTVDGETDAADILDAMIEQVQNDEAMAMALKERATSLAARKSRIESRSRAMKMAMLPVLDALGLKKVERPLATVSRRSGSQSVEITDDKSIPSQLRRPGLPDKTAIKKQIEAGEVVPGARIVTGPDGITMRAN